MPPREVKCATSASQQLCSYLAYRGTLAATKMGSSQNDVWARVRGGDEAGGARGAGRPPKEEEVGTKGGALARNSPPGSWYPFEATLTSSELFRETVNGMPQVDGARIPEDMTEVRMGGKRPANTSPYKEPVFVNCPSPASVNACAMLGNVVRSFASFVEGVCENSIDVPRLRVVKRRLHSA